MLVPRQRRIEFPHQFSVPGHFKNPPPYCVGNHRVSVGQALGAAAYRAVESFSVLVLVAPYNSIGRRIHFHNAGVPPSHAIVKDQNVAIVEHPRIVRTLQLTRSPLPYHAILNRIDNRHHVDHGTAPVSYTHLTLPTS